MASIEEARLALCEKLTYSRFAVFSLVPVKKRGLRTAAVDIWWRLYYDPDWIEQSPIGTAIAAVAHEWGHLALNHFKRANAFMPRLPRPSCGTCGTGPRTRRSTR
jgi:predicted metal-dependent peptidase